MKPRKTILSRYAMTPVNNKFFMSVDVASSGELSDKNAYMWAPYITSVSPLDEQTPEEVRNERLKKLKRIFNK